MATTTTYRFCTNEKCKNRIAKKPLGKAETCLLCGSPTKDYQFDIVRRVIVEDNEPTESIEEESLPVAETSVNDDINFTYIDGNMVDTETGEIFGQTQNEIPKEETKPNSTPETTNKDKENESLRQQMAQMAELMAKMQRQLDEQSKQLQSKPSEIKATVEREEAVSPVKGEEKPVEEKPTEAVSPEKIAEEKKRKEIAEKVRREHELAEEKKRREQERIEFEKKYNEQKEKEKQWEKEEREKQEKILENGEKEAEVQKKSPFKELKDGFGIKHNEKEKPEMPEKPKINLNEDGYYDSYEVTYEELYKKSMKKTIKQVGMLTIILLATLYGVLYFFG